MLNSIRELVITQEPIPYPKDGEVLVKLEAVGICGSDLHYFLDGGLGTFKAKLPMRMGHEPFGIVALSKSKYFINGERVAIEPGAPCLQCHWCCRGLHNLCPQGSFFGANGAPGAFQEYIIVKSHQLSKVPGWMTAEDVVMMEPFGVALHAVRRAGVSLGDAVMIFGAGPIGLCISVACKLIGADVTIVDTLEYRVREAVLKWKARLGLFKDEYVPSNDVMVAFDAAGKQETVDGCFKAAEAGGKVVLVGIPTYDYLKYNPHKGRIKELTILNVRRSNQTLDDCITIYDMNRDLQLGDMVTHSFPLERIQEAFELASGYKDRCLKTIIRL